MQAERQRGGESLAKRLRPVETSIVNWALQRPGRPFFRNPHSWAIALLFAGFSILYYWGELGLPRYLPGLDAFSTMVHDFHRALFLIPIVYSTLIFRMRGGLIACLAFLLVALPRAVAYSQYPNSLMRTLVSVLSATLISLLITVLLNEISRARSARAEIADLHAELADSVVRLQESEEQLIQAEKLSSLGQMAASIAHEINNPLAGVLVYTQLLAKKLASDTLSRDVALDYLAKMATEIDRSSRIIRNLLDFARPSELSLGDVDINRVIEDALGLVGHRATLGQIEVVRDLRPDLPKVYADYDQLRQVFVNLTLNAIQATPTGGRVTLRTRTTAQGMLAVSVEDTGCGISEENREKLFTPFFTTKEKGQGVGLGLAVAKGIVEKHAGLVDVESSEDEGTRFVVSLPVQAAPPPDPPSVGAASKGQAEGVNTAPGSAGQLGSMG